jgi:hypothetical protein
MNRYVLLLVCVVGAAAAGCRQKTPSEPGVATPGVTLNRDRVPLGSPLEITYRFEVAPNAPPLKQNYKVFVGVVDSDGELMWTDDHDPAVPTSQWKPGQKIEYTRTVFVPVYPYIGEASIRMGLYSLADQKRVSLTGDDAGQRAYKVARLQLLPQSENVLVMYKDGWHPAEGALNNPAVEWQWTKKQATLAFRNPKKDSDFYFEADNPSTTFPDGQRVQLTVGGQPIADFVLQPGKAQLRKFRIGAAQLGGGDAVEMQIAVDKSFVPALLPASGNKDTRELGIRVFHAAVVPGA